MTHSWAYRRHQSCRRKCSLVIARSISYLPSFRHATRQSLIQWFTETGFFSFVRIRTFGIAKTTNVRPKTIVVVCAKKDSIIGWMFSECADCSANVPNIRHLNERWGVKTNIPQLKKLWLQCRNTFGRRYSIFLARTFRPKGLSVNHCAHYYSRLYS